MTAGNLETQFAGFQRLTGAVKFTMLRPTRNLEPSIRTRATSESIRMSQRLSQEQQQEFTTLQNRCSSVLAFMSAKIDSADPVSVGILRSVAAKVDECVASGDLRGLRELAKEVDRWLRSLPKSMQREFEMTVPRDVAEDLRSDRGREGELTRAWVARGYLATEEEFRIAATRVDEIYADPAFRDEVAELTDCWLTSNAHIPTGHAEPRELQTCSIVQRRNRTWVGRVSVTLRA